MGLLNTFENKKFGEKEKNKVLLDTLIKIFEAVLFFAALVFVLPFISAISLMALSILYYIGYKYKMFEQESLGLMDLINKYFYFPILLLFLALLINDPTLKLSIIAFSAQGAMKALVKTKI